MRHVGNGEMEGNNSVTGGKWYGHATAAPKRAGPGRIGECDSRAAQPVADSDTLPTVWAAWNSSVVEV
jgi:hypothetical protein